MAHKTHIWAARIILYLLIHLFTYLFIHLYFSGLFLLGIKRKMRFIIKAGGGELVTVFCKLSAVAQISLKIVSLLILVLFREVECCAKVGGARVKNIKILKSAGKLVLKIF